MSKDVGEYRVFEAVSEVWNELLHLAFALMSEENGNQACVGVFLSDVKPFQICIYLHFTAPRSVERGG